MRLLGIDFGGRHIGVAVAETDHKIATPRKNLVASGTLAKDAQAILQIFKKEEADRLVLGLPLDQNGETKMSKVCRLLGTQLEALGVAVSYVDESMTSQEAESLMLSAGLKGSQIRKSVDGEAACRILQRFMEHDGE